MCIVVDDDSWLFFKENINKIEFRKNRLSLDVGVLVLINSIFGVIMFV